MATTVVINGQVLELESPTDIQAVFQDDFLRETVRNHMEVLPRDCLDFPLVEEARKVTITLELKPQKAKLENYDPAHPLKNIDFNVSVSGPVVPKKKRSYVCGVGPRGDVLYKGNVFPVFREIPGAGTRF